MPEMQAPEGSAKPESRNNPPVRAHPPIVYLAAILVGAVAQWLLPIRPFPTGITRPLGGALVVLAVILVGSALRRFIAAATPFRVDRETRALVTGGPMRFSRNPGYLGLSLSQAGIGLWLNNGWIVGLLAVTVPLMTVLVIIPEERYLAEKFGKAYQDYRAEVRRWL